METISEVEARIHAHICGDGCVYSYKTKRSASDLASHKRKNSYRQEYRIIYTNNESALLELFSDDIRAAYNRKAVVSRKNERMVTGKWIYERLKELGAGKSFDWFISDSVLNSSNNVLKEWLKAFFDDEAYVDLRAFSISLNSVNLNGLMQVKELLGKFKIFNTTLCGPYFSKLKGKTFHAYRLKIMKKDVERFRVYIGFNHPKKRRELDELLDEKELRL